MKWMPVDPVGELYSWTRVHRAFGGEPAADLPYVTGVVSIAAAPGVRLVCLQQASARDPVIGTTGQTCSGAFHQGKPVDIQGCFGALRTGFCGVRRLLLENVAFIPMWGKQVKQ
jgi:hypothetical protein